jgi:hypothetical protein
VIITCPTFIERVTALQEDALGGFARAQCRLHLSYCRGCQRYLEQMEQIAEAARAEPTSAESRSPPDADQVRELAEVLRRLRS